MKDKNTIKLLSLLDINEYISFSVFLSFFLICFVLYCSEIMYYDRKLFK